MPPGGVGGVIPPKKSKIGGPNLRGGSPDMVELQNFKLIKDLLAENFEFFLRGPWNGRGSKFWTTPPPPQSETSWHGPGLNINSKLSTTALIFEVY